MQSEQQTIQDMSGLGLTGPMPEAIPEAEAFESVFAIRSGSLGLLIPSNRYCEVLDKVQVNPLPNVHPWLSGILNLRGNLVPVFDLAMVLQEPIDHKKRRLFSIDRGDKAVALWIDNYPEIKNKLTLKPMTSLPSLPEIIQRCLLGGYEQDNLVWLDLKYEDLFKALGRHQYTEAEKTT